MLCPWKYLEVVWEIWQPLEVSELFLTSFCLPLVHFLFFFVLSVMLWEVESFHSGGSLAFWPDWVLELRWWKQDARGDTGCLDNIRLECKCSAVLFRLFWNFCVFFSSVRFTDRGLQATVFVNMAPRLATSPCFRLVSGCGSKFLGGQPPLFLCVSVCSFNFI
jgi:hypothetical protein